MLYRRVKCRENVITKYMYVCEVKSAENFSFKHLHVYFMLMKKLLNLVARAMFLGDNILASSNYSTFTTPPFLELVLTPPFLATHPATSSHYLGELAAVA